MVKRIRTFFGEAKSELKKVTWPSRHEVYGSTVVVLTITFLLAAMIALVDIVVSKTISFLLR